MSKLKSNLHEILADRNLKPADLVKLTGLPQPTVSRILKGEQDNPTLSTLTALAKGLEVPLGRLLGDGLEMKEAESVRSLRKVPLLNWVQAGTPTLVAPNHVAEWYVCPVDISENGYALEVRGESMEPKFQEGDIVFVDPDLPAEPGKIVIAQDETFSETDATMKKLVIEGREAYLKALNPDWPGPKFIKLTPFIKIVGVVVGKYVPV